MYVDRGKREWMTEAISKGCLPSLVGIVLWCGGSYSATPCYSVSHFILKHTPHQSNTHNRYQFKGAASLLPYHIQVVSKYCSKLAKEQR